ncbi:DUF3541 domain-containing protein [Photobacterium sp. ZSDE20]|uniref:DUF3541 domain-containing protein n=1 Tax=Photobacterium pectinilyticum TaxID=2906793 RepID=A0ABT1MZP0_9GAMM|nr:DUF3541 domain-containing protein [Photobacterium sp. ZSDE20]MCQ1057963.1 DUF3541 domain-containing protein [Photobacterium sp. ZSDE20]MDD1822495.1 DUF3541 domain-containing protein [Photobacterium sp. ZSDE20]
MGWVSSRVHRAVVSSLVAGAVVTSPLLWADVQSAAEQGLNLSAGGVNATSSADTASFLQDAERIRQTYESQLFTLPAFKMGHYGLRMYRQTQDPKYQAAIWSDMARVASRLNFFATEVYTSEQIDTYSAERIARYDRKEDARSDLRYETTKDKPEYYYLGVDLLGSMARANEYGLKHREDAKLREVIRRYDFKEYATDPEMIRAWAAQLANQVYWLRQLGEQDVVDDFTAAFKETYPDSLDGKLTDQQFMNKVYGLTHIIFAATEYYQHSVKESDYQWIYDYYRDNIDTIIARAKEDVIAEVGINFLLAGLKDDPVVDKTRKAIQHSLNRQAGIIPAINGSTSLLDGEHRNVLAIMLLDWRGTNAVPTIQKQPEIFTNKPYGLITK